MVYNSITLSTTSYLLFYANYRYEIYTRRDLRNIKNSVVGTNNKA